MPPKGVSKAVSKKCPECKKQIPVATRICVCYHQFFEERRRSTSSLNQEQSITNVDTDDLHSIRPQRSPGEISNTSSTSNSIQEVIHSVSISGTVSPMLPSTSKANGAAASVEGGKRRSERVKREKPNFYDALEYDNKMRKARRERQKDDIQLPQTSTISGRVRRERKGKNTSSHDEDDDEELIVKEKKRRKKKKKVKKEEEDQEEEDILTGITPYRERSFAFVLADINMKLGLNNPAFINIK